MDEQFKKIKFLIYINYLLCVLLINLHMLDIDELIIILIRTWLSLQDAFSDEFIYNYEIFN